MKKLLGVIGILALVAALLPAQGYADLRGAFSLVTNGVPFPTGCEQGAVRHGQTMPNPIVDGAATTLDRFIVFTSRSLIPFHEHVRGIYELLNEDQAFGRGEPLIQLKVDPVSNISYFDPAWSFDAKYLAYIQNNADGSDQHMWVQEYMVSTNAATAGTPVGDPILIDTGNARHPHWSATGYTIVYDNDTAGTIDVYTVDFADADANHVNDNAPIRRTFDNVKAEAAPAWNPVASNAPGRYDIVYSTNKFGPNVLEMIDIDLPNNDPAYAKLAETNFNFVSHGNPSWTYDGNGIFYDAPSNEDPNSLSSVWKLDIPTQSKCEIQLDIRADADPYSSRIMNHSRNGFPDDVLYNNFLFTTQAGGAGVNVWRGNPVNSCSPALPMGVNVDPTTINLDNNSQGSSEIHATLTFPAETKAAGYQAQTFNGPMEGIRARASIYPSPAMVGLAVADDNGDGVGDCVNQVQAGEPGIDCTWHRRAIANRMVALGLVNQVVPIKVTAYSNRAGRAFTGFGYLKLSSNSTGASSAMLLNNSPNPFNPVTTIKMVVSKAGNYSVRVYNVQGALVKSLASGHYETGVHEVAWDGRTNGGGKAASGVYYAKISGGESEGGDAIRLVLAK